MISKPHEKLLSLCLCAGVFGSAPSWGQDGALSPSMQSGSVQAGPQGSDMGGGGFSGGQSTGLSPGGGGDGTLLGLRQVDSPMQLTLQDALTHAARENFDLRLVQETIIQQEANIRRAWSFLLPRVSIGSAYTYSYPEQSVEFIDEDQLQQQALLYRSLADLTEASSSVSSDRRQRLAGQERAEELRRVANDLETTSADPIVVQPAHNLSGEVSVSMPLFNGRLIPLLLNSYDGVELSKAAAHQLQSALLYTVARTYYTAASAKKMMSLVDRQVVNAKAHAENVAGRVELGAATPLSLQRAQLNVVRAEQSKRDMMHGYRMALGGLGSLMGLDTDFDVVEPESMVPVEDGQTVEELLSRALKNRPERKVQKLSVTVADRSRTDAWMMFAPSFAIVGRGRYNSNTSGLTPQPLTGAVMVTASIPIYDGGERYAALKESASRVRTELLKTKQLETRIGQEVRGALSDVRLKKEALTSAEDSAALARETAKSAKDFYELGLATSLDVIDADLAVHLAEIEAVQSKFALEQARIRLAYTIGEYPNVLHISLPNAARSLSDDERSSVRRSLESVRLP